MSFLIWRKAQDSVRHLSKLVLHAHSPSIVIQSCGGIQEISGSPTRAFGPLEDDEEVGRKNINENLIEIAQIKGNRLFRYFIDFQETPKRDDIFKGQIFKKFKDYYLIDIGLSDLGILPRKKLSFDEGQKVIVQVKKLSKALDFERKGVVLTTNIALASACHIFFPRNHLDLENPTFQERDAAKNSSHEELELSKQWLLNQWQQVLDSSLQKGLILKGATLFERFLRDSSDVFIVEDRGLLEDAIVFRQKYNLSTQNIRLAESFEKPLPKFFDIEEQLLEAKSPQIPLKNGSEILRFETVMGTFFDVNANSADGYQSNLLAAEKIGEIIRILNITCDIFIDFIDSGKQRKNSREDFVKVLTKTFSEKEFGIISWSPLGLLELRRQN